MKHTILIITYLFIYTTYSQCITGNCSNGYGVKKYEDGTMYIGDWWNETPSGHGTVVWSDGSIYVGKFNKGMYSGEGTLITNSSIYIGEFDKDLPNGSGTVLMPPGMYVGEFQDGTIEGKGYFIDKNGHIEESYWKKNQPIGDTLLTRENYILRGYEK